MDEGDPGKLVESTVGRFIFNEGLPQDLGFVDRSKEKYRLEVDFICGKKQLGQIIDKCFRAHENTGTVSGGWRLELLSGGLRGTL